MPAACAPVPAPCSDDQLGPACKAIQDSGTAAGSDSKPETIVTARYTEIGGVRGIEQLAPEMQQHHGIGFKTYLVWTLHYQGKRLMGGTCRYSWETTQFANGLGVYD